VNDDAVENPETFTVTLSSPTGGSVLGTVTTHTVTINDDDGPSTIAFSGASTSVLESSGQVVVNVHRSGNTASSATVQVAASSGSATSGEDYSFESSIVTFAPGVSTQTITIPLVDDVEQEDAENFEIVLSNPSIGVNLGSLTTHIITILNDEEDVPEFSKASYHGIAASTNSANAEYGGIIVKTTGSGQLTGTVQVQGKTLRFQGRFSETGSFTHDFPRRPLSSSLELQFGNAGSSLTGTFQTVDGIIFEVEAKRDVVATNANPIAEAAAYNALLETQLTNNPAGFVRARVRPSGKISLSGMLPDGTRLSASSHLAEDRSFPIYFPAQAKKLGFLAGTAQLDSQEAWPLSADLHWSKPADSRPPYADGLTDELVEVSGCVYTPPHRARILDDFNLMDGTAIAQVTAGINFQVNWKPNNTVQPITPLHIHPRLKLQPSTGLFTGSYKDDSGKKRKLYGICLQQAAPGEDVAAGFCLGDETSTHVGIVLDL
jgi:hypothetical protein